MEKPKTLEQLRAEKERAVTQRLPGLVQSAILEQPKPQANKTDKNKTEWNGPDPIYSGGIREQLEDCFCQALEIDLLLRLCPLLNKSPAAHTCLYKMFCHPNR